MSFLLISHKDLWNIQLVCKQWYKDMIECTKLCSLQGKFTDQQIFHIMTIMTVEEVVPKWKREISILGGCTADGVIALMSGHVKWTSVKIANCHITTALYTLLDNHYMVGYINHACLHGLEKLDLSHSGEDVGLGDVLRWLYFGRCMFPDIQKLRLRDMDIRDDMFMVLQRHPKLKEVDLSGNRLLTNNGLRSYYTFQRDPHRDFNEVDARLGVAVKVKVVNCPHITDDYVQQLREDFPTAVIQTD